MIWLILFCLILANTIVMFSYCCFEERHDAKLRKKKENSEKEDSDKEEKQSVAATETVKEKTVKALLFTIYLYLRPYLYGLMRYEIICVGKLPSHRLRCFIYKHIFRMKITRKSVIYGGCEFRSPWNIHMDNCVVSIGCIFDGRNEIYIGENVVFGSGVRIWTEEHNVNDPYFSILPENARGVYIGERAWICSDSTLLPGVYIGKGAVIASRACVSKDCEEFSVYGGVPAKKIKDRNPELLYELSGKPHWHFY